jgi:hypothetical protein
MANILHFLRDLLENEETQQRFEHDRVGLLKEQGLGDLSGEDVVEAVRQIRHDLTGEAAARLGGYADESGATPPARPLVGESELDAAVRQLVHVVSLVTGRAARVQPVRPEQATAAPLEATAAPAGDEIEEPMEMPTEVTPPSDDADAIRFELASVVEEASARVGSALRRADELAASTIQFAEAEAASIRAAAEADAEELRQMASEEADAMLSSAKAAREEANERLESARVAEEDARARREEILATQQRLQEKLAEVETVVHSLRGADAD